MQSSTQVLQMNFTRTKISWRQTLSLLGLAAVLGPAVPTLGQTTLPLHPEESEAAVESPTRVSSPSQPAAEASENSLASQDPQSLIGQRFTAVLPELTSEGWYIAVQTPRLIQMQNDRQGLDLELDPGSGEILQADFVNL